MTESEFNGAILCHLQTTLGLVTSGSEEASDSKVETGKLLEQLQLTRTTSNISSHTDQKREGSKLKLKPLQPSKTNNKTKKQRKLKLKLLEPTNNSNAGRRTQHGSLFKSNSRSFTLSFSGLKGGKQRNPSVIGVSRSVSPSVEAPPLPSYQHLHKHAKKVRFSMSTNTNPMIHKPSHKHRRRKKKTAASTATASTTTRHESRKKSSWEMLNESLKRYHRRNFAMTGEDFETIFPKCGETPDSSTLPTNRIRAVPVPVSV